MQSGLYVTLSAQMSLQKRLDTIANNVANASTAGYRAEEIRFESLVSSATLDPVAFATTGTPYLARRAGEFVRTDNPLDVAVEGDAWLGIQTPAGLAYTRDGRFKMTAAGELQTLNGYAVLDNGGAAILLDPNGGPPSIGRDGSIHQSNRQIAQIGLYQIDARANLTRTDNAGVIPDRPATPATDLNLVGVSQGFIERANVNPVLEMSKLILVSRSFEAVTASVRETESSFQDAIKTLGS